MFVISVRVIDEINNLYINRRLTGNIPLRNHETDKAFLVDTCSLIALVILPPVVPQYKVFVNTISKNTFV